jgi:hypothetical protein
MCKQVSNTTSYKMYILDSRTREVLLGSTHVVRCSQGIALMLLSMARGSFFFISGRAHREGSCGGRPLDRVLYHVQHLNVSRQYECLAFKYFQILKLLTTFFTTMDEKETGNRRRLDIFHIYHRYLVHNTDFSCFA